MTDRPLLDSATLLADTCFENMVTTNFELFFLQRRVSFSRAVVTNLEHSLPVPDLWQSQKAYLGWVPVWGLPGADVLGFIPRKLWFYGRRWSVPQFGHSRDHAEAVTGTQILKLGSALRFTNLEVTSVLVKQGHSTAAHNKALCVAEQHVWESTFTYSRALVSVQIK